MASDGKDKSVLDPGSLWPHTPAYASYEMLTGQVLTGQLPSVTDDIYALAVVAYEFFTGKHPYDHVPADKAMARGLEPEPIPFLKRRQWKALRKGLEFRAEDRTDSIAEFMKGMF
jgi:serine/threonine protein kinase|tara:strand:+ start:1357 stop:1701 length:345 start_codon:yes stop_codon:yes gene_type:complete